MEGLGLKGPPRGSPSAMDSRALLGCSLGPVMGDRQGDSRRGKTEVSPHPCSSEGGGGGLLLRDSEISVSTSLCVWPGDSFETQITSLPCSKLSTGFPSTQNKPLNHPRQDLPGPIVVPSGSRSTLGSGRGICGDHSRIHTTIAVLARRGDNFKFLGWSHTAQKCPTSPETLHHPLEVPNAAVLQVNTKCFLHNFCENPASRNATGNDVLCFV